MSTEASGRRLVAVNHTGLLSGAEVVLLRVLEAACARGWSASAAVPDGALVSELTGIGVPVEPIPDLMLPDGPRVVAAPRLAARTITAAARIRAAAADADLVLAGGVRALPALRVANVGAPVVWLAQGVLDRPRWRRLVAACARSVDLAIAVSGAVADSIDDRHFPVRVIWNGTRWPVDPAPPEPPSPPVIGCAAILTSWKGQHVLLDAVARLEQRDVVVELLGGTFPKDRSYVEALERRAAQPDLEGRVRFAGHVDDTLARMRRWTVAVVPSVDPEAGPLSALEAMSVGVPLVASDHGGPPEILGAAGVLVPPGDPDTLAGALTLLLNDPDRRARCSAAGRRLVASGLTLDAQMDAVVNALEEAARGTALRTPWLSPPRQLPVDPARW
ncbi:MAG: glycosyltransferase family 4 protein [Actinomycetota bacterium]|nr:glycosyltransferase family 4 protein [Actinomycetota bacterium]